LISLTLPQRATIRILRRRFETARRLGAVGVLVLGPACGGPAVDPVVRPPTLVITAAPPPAPTRAKWAFSDQSESMNAKLDLGKDTGVLFVGDNGRRSLIKGRATAS